jgi:hypothetical protein
MHIFPTTQNLPRIVARKLEERAAAAAAPVEPAELPPAERPRSKAQSGAAAPRKKRVARKAASLPTP